MNNGELNIDVQKLKPFTRFIYTIGILPTSYLLSMTYEEQLIWLCNYLKETVIPTINNNGQAVEELQTKYIELKSYVDNYFDNLDIQEEINNKLDEMAQDGTLSEIITTYLQMNGVLGFDNKTDLKTSTNLINGSIVKTLGKITYKDGKGHYYKIRNILNTDVIDDENIIALTNYPNLIAELVPRDIDFIYKNKKPLNMKNIVIIGDSYGELSQQSTWIDVVLNKLGLTSSEYTRKTESSTGFLNTNSYTNHKFIDLLQLAKEDLTADERADVTHIIICGGANDMKPQYSISDLTTAISQFITYAKNNFTNAKVYIGMIGFTTDINVKKYLGRVLEAYEKCIAYDGVYLNGVQNASHYYPYFNLTTSDTVHPNQNGSTAIGNAVYEALMRGSVSIMRDWELVSDSISYEHLYSYSNNDNYKLKLETPFRIRTESNLILNPSNVLHIMDFNGGCVGGIASPTYGVQGTVMINTEDNQTIKVNGTYKLSSYIHSDGVTIRQRLDFYPYEIDSSVSGSGGYKKITNAYYLYVTPTVLDMSIYDC